MTSLRRILLVALVLGCGALAGTVAGAAGRSGAAHKPAAFCVRREHGRCVRTSVRRCGRRVRVHGHLRCNARAKHKAPVGNRPTAATGPTTSSYAPTTPIPPSTTPGTTPTAPSLPHQLEVDETDQPGPWSTPYNLSASYSHVASGSVSFSVVNQGQDEHTFAIVAGTDLSGPRLAYADLPAGSTQSLAANLPPGTYTLLCTLYDHAQHGMKTTITVG